MLGVFGTEATVLLVLNASGLFLLVLRCRIIPILTNGAFQCYDVSHFILRNVMIACFSLVLFSSSLRPGLNR